MKRAKTNNCKHSSSNVTCLTFVKRETLHAHFNNVIYDEEFVFLFYLNSSKIPDIKYWKYHTFDLNSCGDDVVSQF